MKVHIVGLAHTIPTEEFSHCAFTGKVMRLPACLATAKLFSVLYANGSAEEISSCGRAVEPVPIIPREALELIYEKHGGLDQVYRGSTDQNLKNLYEQKLIFEMRRRVKRGDVVCHPFGNSHEKLVSLFPEAIHVESGIGYTAPGFGCAARIFESEAWRHWHIGKYSPGPGTPGDLRDGYVIPNYYDVDDWPRGECNAWEEESYILFVGRLHECKGIDIIAQLALEMPSRRFVIAGGPGECPEILRLPNVEFRGLVKGKDRAKLYGDAFCTVVPSQYCEPFGGVAAESMLCGTPVVASDWGGFTDYVPEHNRCRTIEDYINAIQVECHKDRWAIREEAQMRFGYTRTGRQYRDVFKRLGADV